MYGMPKLFRFPKKDCQEVNNSKIKKEFFNITQMCCYMMRMRLAGYFGCC